MTVKEPVLASELGTTLVHEHVLVDFIGADKADPSRWKAARKIWPESLI